MGTHDEAVKMLIRFYNIQAGTSFRNGNEANQKVMLSALEKCDFTVGTVKQLIKEFIQTHPADAKGNLSSFLDYVEIKTSKEKKIEQEQKAVTEQSVSTSLGIIEKAVAQIIVNTQAEQIKSDIMENVQQTVRDFVKSEYGTIERKIITVVDGKRVPMEGIQHEKFEEVLKYVANNMPVFLTGPAGSGKNVLCKQIADALGLKFYFTNAVTQEYKLTGFTDAMGNFQETSFYKAFTQGGLFMLDEMDASIPEVLVTLNAAIANKYCDFPAPIGYVEAHPDFRLIAAGNTFGTGASYEYVGRNQLDAASLNRFVATIKIDYSEAIENNVAGGDIELADFCRAFRKTALAAGQQIVISYRNIGAVATMSKVLPLDKVLEACMVKGMEKDDLNIIIRDIGMDNKYTRALREIAKRL